MPEKISKSTIYENLLNAFITKFAEEKRLNPADIQLREGDIIKSILESVASELFLRYLEILDYYNSFSIYNVNGEELDLRAKDYNLTRNPATPAIGFGVFNLNPPALKDYTINLKNTIVSNRDGTKIYNFAPDIESIVIPSGSDTSTLLKIISNSAGLIYNAEINEINTIQKLDITPSLSGSNITFNNITAVTGGSDIEEDESFRSRILLKLSGINKGTYDYFLNLVNNFEPSNGNRILSASIKEAFMDNYSKLYIYTSRADPSTALTPFVKQDVITNDYLLSYKIDYVPAVNYSILWRQDYLDSGSTFTELVKYGTSGSNWDYILNEATGEIVFNGGNNRVILPSPGLMSGNEIIVSGSYYAGEYNELQLKINDPAERVIGVNLKVMPVDVYIINEIVIKIKVMSGLSIDIVKPDIKRGVDRYINILKPGDDFIVSRMIDFIYDEVGEKVVDLKVVTPANNIAVNENQKIIYSVLILQAL